MRSASTTVATLKESQIRDLLAVAANPRHKMIASRIVMFRQLGLLVPTEPPRPPIGSRIRRGVPSRAHRLTQLAIDTLVGLGRLSPPSVEAEAHL